MPGRRVSTTTRAGFNTQSIVVDQTSRGAALESTWAATDNFRLHAILGYMNVDVDVDDPNPATVAPLTPELTASLSPELTFPLEAARSRCAPTGHDRRRSRDRGSRVRRPDHRPACVGTVLMEDYKPPPW
jgi:hypothetical protein